MLRACQSNVMWTRFRHQAVYLTWKLILSKTRTSHTTQIACHARRTPIEFFQTRENPAKPFKTRPSPFKPRKTLQNLSNRIEPSKTHPNRSKFAILPECFQTPSNILKTVQTLPNSQFWCWCRFGTHRSQFCFYFRRTAGNSGVHLGRTAGNSGVHLGRTGGHLSLHSGRTAGHPGIHLKRIAGNPGAHLWHFWCPFV
mgnify:CR=1 FL=1